MQTNISLKTVVLNYNCFVLEDVKYLKTSWEQLTPSLHQQLFRNRYLCNIRGNVTSHRVGDKTYLFPSVITQLAVNMKRPFACHHLENWYNTYLDEQIKKDKPTSWGTKAHLIPLDSWFSWSHMTTYDICSIHNRQSNILQDLLQCFVRENFFKFYVHSKDPLI